MGEAYPRTVEEIFEDFTKRRSGLLRALTDGELGWRPPLIGSRRQSPPTVRLRGYALLLCPVLLASINLHVYVDFAEVDDFYQQCDSERDNLCLYGERTGTWSVDLPAEEVPPELPEPCLGINFARDGMARKDWLALVAVHSDAWLMAVAFFYAVKLDQAGR
jgi:hypothetical protein